MLNCQNCGKPAEVTPFTLLTNHSFGKWSSENSIESIVHSNAIKPLRCENCSSAIAKNQLMTTCWMLLLIAVGLLYYFIQGPVGHH